MTNTKNEKAATLGRGTASKNNASKCTACNCYKQAERHEVKL